MHFHGCSLLLSSLMVCHCVHVAMVKKAPSNCMGHGRPVKRSFVKANGTLWRSFGDYHCALGDTLVIPCHINITKSINFTFTKDGEEFDVNGSFINKFDNGTILLSYPNIQKDMNEVIAKCCMKLKCVSGRISVGHKLDKPSISAMVFHAKNRTLVVSWTFSLPPDSVYSVYYFISIFREDERLKNCSQRIRQHPEVLRSLGSCNYEFKPGVLLPERMKSEVEAGNHMGSVFNRKEAVLTSITKVEQVNNLMVNVSSHSIAVSWKLPDINDLNVQSLPGEQRDSVNFDVQLMCTSNHSSPAWGKLTQKNGTVGLHTFRALRPFTPYTICVRVKIHQSEVWSDWRNKTVQTHPSVPGANPLVVPGGFESREKHEGSRDVVFYWQEVPESLRNGVLTGYIVSCTHGGIQTTDITNLTSHMIVDLPLEDAILLSVKAQNTEGINHNLDVNVTYVPPASRLPLIPANFTTIVVDEDEKLVNLSWAKPAADTNSITAWYCKRRHDGTCEGQVHWRELTGDVMFVGVSLDGLPQAVSEMMYGLSVEKGTQTEPKSVNSGIHWGDSVYYLDGYIRAPKVVISGTNQWSRECKISLSSTKTARKGYVYSYKLRYCAINPEHICTETDKKDMYVSSETRDVTLLHLSPGHEYKVNVSSLTAKGESQPYMANCTTAQSFFTTKNIIIIVVVSAVLLFFLVVGIVVCIRKPMRRLKKALNIPISLPDLPVEVDRPVVAVLPIHRRGSNSTANSYDISDSIPHIQPGYKWSCPAQYEDSTCDQAAAASGHIDYGTISSRDMDNESASPYSKVPPWQDFPVCNRPSEDLEHDFEEQLSAKEPSLPSSGHATEENISNQAAEELLLEFFHEEPGFDHVEPMQNNPTGTVSPSLTETVYSGSPNSDGVAWFPIDFDEAKCKDGDYAMREHITGKSKVDTSAMSEDSEESLLGGGHAYASGKSVENIMEFSPLPDGPAMPVGHLSSIQGSSSPTADTTVMSEDSNESLSDGGHGYASGQSVENVLTFHPVPDWRAVSVGQSSGTHGSSSPNMATIFTDIPEGSPKDHMVYNLPLSESGDVPGNNDDNNYSVGSSLWPPRGNMSKDLPAANIGPDLPQKCVQNVSFGSPMYAGCSNETSPEDDCGDNDNIEDEEDVECDETSHLYT